MQDGIPYPRRGGVYGGVKEVRLTKIIRANFASIVADIGLGEC